MNRQTVFDFTLPVGYVTAAGEVHRSGRMRLATALDEAECVAHPRVQANEAYLPIVLLSRVLVSLGSLSEITPQIVEGLYAADMAYLEDLYMRLNSYEGMAVSTRCPQCGAHLEVQVAPLSAAQTQRGGTPDGA